MKVLVTGATGLLGGYLIRDLLQCKAEIRVLVLPGEDVEMFLERNIEVVRGDITDPSTLLSAMQDIELLFHLAGIMGVWRPLSNYMHINVAGTEHLFYAACQAGVRRFVHISSFAVYGLGHDRILSEDAPLRPDPDPYSLSKVACEHLLRRLSAQQQMEMVIVRPGAFFGPGDYLHFGHIARKLKAGKGVILGKGNNTLPFCYVSDIAQGIMLAGYRSEAAGQIYNIGHDYPLTQIEFFKAIAQAIGGMPPGLHIPYQSAYYGSIVAEQLVAPLTRSRPFMTRLETALYGTENRLCIEKAQHELGYRPHVSIYEGINQTAEWFNLSQVNARSTVRLK